MKTTVDVSMVTLDPRGKATHPDLAPSLASFRLETDVINTEPNSWRKKGSCGGEERIKGVTEKGRGGADVGEDRMMALTENLGRRSSSGLHKHFLLSACVVSAVTGAKLTASKGSGRKKKKRREKERQEEGGSTKSS